MEFKEYQRLALRTDKRTNRNDPVYRLIPILGMIGEIGSVAAEHKKLLRDGKSYTSFEDKLKKELGDVLWYISTIASDMNIALEDVAETNLSWTTERWKDARDVSNNNLYDDSYPVSEQLPRHMTIIFKKDNQNKMCLYYEGTQLGDALDDNSHEDDGYRFHDVFHLAYMAVLGWSPVMRCLLKRKRKSKPDIDRVEDGARAIIIEEAVSAMLFEHAKDHRFYDSITVVDHDILTTIKRMVAIFEVKNVSTALWEKAILAGYSAYRFLSSNGGGVVKINLENQTIEVEQV